MFQIWLELLKNYTEGPLFRSQRVRISIGVSRITVRDRTFGIVEWNQWFIAVHPHTTASCGATTECWI